jgi:hypothetical protein
MKINTVITAAGDSESVFLNAGFETPKNLLVVDGKEVLLRAATSYAHDLSRTTISLNREECLKWPTLIMVEGWHSEIRIVQVSSMVPGALVSAILALENIPLDEPLVVAAGDSEITGGIKNYIREFISSGIDLGTIVFKSQNPRWSYIATGKNDYVQQVAEKRVIGPLATTGVFYFQTAQSFLHLAEWCFTNNAMHLGRFYLSSTINAAIIHGLKVKYIEIPRSEYRSWSLPVDFIEQQG